MAQVAFKSLLIESKDAFIINGHYRDHGWLGDARVQAISSHEMYLTRQQYSGLGNTMPVQKVKRFDGAVV